MANVKGEVSQWWQLFDALCIERGHFDNVQMASQYCELTRSRGYGAHQSAQKNLSNWRRGLHLPSRRNFRILTTLLDIDGTGEVSAHWSRLYEEAVRRDAGRAESSSGAVAPTAAPAGLLPGRPAAVAALLLALAMASAALFQFVDIFQTPSSQAADRLVDMTGQRIPWRERIVLKVGDSAVVHGARGRCGEQPPDWEAAAEKLPPVTAGYWSDGGVGYRISASCGGSTPARAIVFTAVEPGEESFFLYEDPVTILVED